jgi:putative FmdB family regulatory protein
VVNGRAQVEADPRLTPDAALLFVEEYHAVSDKRSADRTQSMRGGSAMPVYEYHCEKCDHEVTLTLTISEHEKGSIKCPTCGGKALRPLLSAFVSQTSKKS